MPLSRTCTTWCRSPADTFLARCTIWLIEEHALHINGITCPETSKANIICDQNGNIWGIDIVIARGYSIIPTRAAGNPTLMAICFVVARADKIIKELRPKVKDQEDSGLVDVVGLLDSIR
ncbi:hypothetical protein F5X99DRAFT_405906 [Biscogniauxia marginata]|nr:hypothetical protein F5X99DRAFT_405906 [Biscogniauxia marginata]